MTSQSPATFLSPVALVSLQDSAPPTRLDPERTLPFKTWLGYRYDRPAVPDRLIPLAKDIAYRAKRRGGRDFATGLHDVLMQFDDSGSQPRFALFAVMCDDTDPEEARRWLANVGTAVRSDLGIMSDVEVGYRSQTPLSLIEESYAADVTQLSWRGPDSTETGPIEAGE